VKRTLLVIVLLMTVLLLTVLPFARVSAHATSDTYLRLELRERTLEGFWNVALRDLDAVLKLDRNGNRALSQAELDANRTQITTHMIAHLQVTADGVRCSAKGGSFEVNEAVKGAYLSLALSITCPDVPRKLSLEQTLFFGADAGAGQHRGYLALSAGDQALTGVFTPDHTREQFEIGQINFVQSLLAFVGEGIRHILEGYDHILFLLALLLPSVLRREAGAWQPVHNFREALSSVLKVVTAFTVAHSITLALAAFEVLRLPSRLVESVVAASVVLAALNNVFPIIRERGRWQVAFIFGLIHGFGFSSVLSELVLDRRGLLSSLLGFNLGVELGQLLIVLIFLPLAFVLRASIGYRRVALGAGSFVVAIVAGIWLVERLLDFKVLPI
jgi:hypothetical protein